MKLFSEKTININIAAQNKMEAIDEMMNMLLADGILNDRDRYKQAILQREGVSNTAIGFGIAIPHAKTDAVNKPCVAVAVSRKGIDFESSDGTLVNLIFMIAVPNNADDVHLKILAKLSRKLIDSAFRSKLIQTENKQEILNYLNEIVI